MIDKYLDLRQQNPPSDSANHSGDSATSVNHCANRGYRRKSSSYWETFTIWLFIFVTALVEWIVRSVILYFFGILFLPLWITALINPSNSLKVLNSFGLASALTGFIIVQAHEHPNSAANGNQKLRGALSKESTKALGDALQLFGLYIALLMDYWFLIPTVVVAVVWGLVYFFKFKKSKENKRNQRRPCHARNWINNHGWNRIGSYSSGQDRVDSFHSRYRPILFFDCK